VVRQFKLWCVFVLYLSLFSFLPVFSSWVENKQGVVPVDLAFPLCLGVALSILAASIFYPIFLKNQFVGLLIGLITLALVKHPKLIPIPWFSSSRVRLFFSLLPFLFLIGWISCRWIKKGTVIEGLSKALKVSVVVAFLAGLLPVIRVIWTEWPQFFYQPRYYSFGTLSKTQEKPDIYYLVFDRYTSEEVLKSQFGFKNDLVDFLRARGFYANPSAYAPYPNTTTSISATLSANYHTEIVKNFAASSSIPYDRTIQYAPVIKVLKKLDYSYYHLGSWYEATNQAPLADYNFQKEGVITLLGHPIILNSFARDLISGEPILERFLSKGVRVKGYPIFEYLNVGECQATLEKLKELRRLAEEKPGGRFIFAHILSPHPPSCFWPDGSLKSQEEAKTLSKETYLEQIQFLNPQIEDLVLTIQKKSQGKAIIILQADEGPYPRDYDSRFQGGVYGEKHSDMGKWDKEALKMKYGILAAYYLPGAKKEDLVSAADSINIFRLIFNTYFQGHLTYLPRCYYGYSLVQNRGFVFVDLSKQLTGQQNTICQVIQ